MKIIQSFGIILSFLLLALQSVQAQDAVDRVQFRGEIIDGPFKDKTIEGFCKRNPRGDIYKQKTKCVMKMSGGFKVTDAKATLEVVGGNRAIRIVLGPSMGANSQKGNFKLSAFQATTYYDREITLFDFPRQFAVADVSIGGVAVAAGTSTTNPDCLIWDIAGDGVFN